MAHSSDCSSSSHGPDPRTGLAPPSPLHGRGFGIRAKLIFIFILIKVIPLLALAGFAWYGQVWLADHVSATVIAMNRQMRDTGEIIAESTTRTAIKALDDAAREALERLTTDTARVVATFLYDRDRDIGAAARFAPSTEAYRSFLVGKTRAVERNKPWVLAADGTSWVPSPATEPHDDAVLVEPTNEDNRQNFSYRPPTPIGVLVEHPLFLEMTFVGLDGWEKVKVTTSDVMSPALRQVSKRENTFVKAETYFHELQALRPGDIYVSDVIGAYVPSPIIGPFTPAAVKARNLPFEPEQAAYAGTENPVGKRFRGLVRWATPVSRDGKIIGWVTLALDHEHLMEFTDHIRPNKDRYSAIPDPASGNYAFMWDYKGRSIVHPRHYFMVGYDADTGEPAIPWLDTELYGQWQASKRPISAFLESVPTFHEQSLKKKGAPELVKAGRLGLDCRYLNHAPQCTGWMTLTSHGGSGSFEIFWSGLRKLTTAASIPYFTGPYAKSPRGFGFVTIGANVDDFHVAATKAHEQSVSILAEHEQELRANLDNVIGLISGQVAMMARDLSVSTVAMCIVVIVVAIWMASFLTRRITTVVNGIRRFRGDELDYRLPVKGHDEMASLAESFNQMADSLQESITCLHDSKDKAEAANRLKSAFLANMSHELRTPLNGIIGFAELIRDEATDPEIRENADVIEQSGKHLLELVNSLLDIAKIEAGAMTLTVEPHNARSIVEQVSVTYRRIAETKGIKFAVEFDRDVPQVVLTDALRLRQVLHNLISNAIKFTQDGTVRVLLGRDGDKVVFQVEDSGPGIPEEMHATIFEKFRQVETSLTRTHSGTGLGLTLARRLVELMGGTIGIRSEVGVGSTFYFTQPVSMSARATKGADLPEPVP